MRKATNPILERRHFEILVGVLHATRQATAGNEAQFDAVFFPAFVRNLVDTNPNFNQARFEKACLDKWGTPCA